MIFEYNSDAGTATTSLRLPLSALSRYRLVLQPELGTNLFFVGTHYRYFVGVLKVTDEMFVKKVQAILYEFA